VPALLEVEDLSVVYKGDRRTIPILDSISLKVDGSQTVGIVGESGSGKSVLLTAILGLLPPHWHITTGSIRLAGQELRGRQATRPRARQSTPAPEPHPVGWPAARQRDPLA
jgi:ABC-type glutathione transport system ATPase component